ncbi:indolepyruvate oxidoreductase subunit beta [Dorea acetigenes]|uniref:Indolepyruvate oxidoreductase subunit beta n=1 Tax=Dorea acetigenes TaxID=2981787 RepID=A0ABT2RIJ3_9FIRM|nr:indolepyruvate oxidoreductase subunit beta [Dorea acetigenes]MCB6414436.1 indolepyruvate oxidoreductase subunit beta [Faecalimonas umbilicata]MCU6685222.1 indolepyruvate oxidoreductase subunit beta [Dorea acetigenes]SCI40712.1 indolepyruvate oxidoreductase subunit beta [uncultured Clostridium sp.]
MRKNCLLCGVGGQGVVLASKLIAYAALDKGMFVRTTETIGMAQRGGSVVSHVRMGEEIHSPMIPKGQADVILAFEPAEAVRSLPYLREGGMLIVNRKAVKPVTATLGGGQYDGHEMLDFLKKKVDNLLIMDGEAVCRQAGSAKVLNVALLGAAAASGALDISIPDMEVEIKKKVKPQFVELNQKALALGAAIAGAQRKADGTKTEVR